MRIAGQNVVEGGTGQVFDPGQTVTRRIAAAAKTGGKTDRDPGTGTAVTGKISAGPAAEQIGPAAPLQRVVAIAAIQAVAIAIAGQIVGTARPGQHLDPGEQIAGGIATKAGAQRQ